MISECKNPLINKLSKKYPFKMALIDVEKPPKSLKKINDGIKESNLSEKINTNDILIIQMLFMLLAVIVSTLLITLKIINILTIPVGVIIYTFVSMLSSSILIKGYIKLLIAKDKKNKLKSITLINSYIVSMLKSNKIVPEILYSLTVVETPYKKNFINGYELYSKNNKEGIEYLIDVFKDTYFKETIKVLGSYSEYNKSSSLKYLERISKNIKRQIYQLNKKKSDKSFIYSQVSVVLPLAVLGLLVIIPIMSIVFTMMKTPIIM